MILEVVQREMRNAMGREEPLLMHLLSLHSKQDGLSQGKCTPGMRHAADWTTAPLACAGTVDSGCLCFAAQWLVVVLLPDL